MNDMHLFYGMRKSAAVTWADCRDGLRAYFEYVRSGQAADDAQALRKQAAADRASVLRGIIEKHAGCCRRKQAACRRRSCRS